MVNRNYRVWSHSILSCLLVFVCVVLVNFVFARTVVRADLTEEHLYTLSDGSVRILERLRDPVTFEVYWGNTPPGVEPQKRFIEGLLEEMEAVAGDELSVRWIDTEDEDGDVEAEEAGINKYTFGSNEGNKRVQTEGYMTLRIESGDERATSLDGLALITNKLEYLIARDLDKRSQVGTAGVGFVNPDSPALSGQLVGRRPGRFNLLQDQMRASFGVGFKALASLEEPVADEIKVLVVAAPWNLSEVAAFHVDQFVTRGGRLLLLLDNVNVENTVFANSEREPRSSGLEDWLIHLGVTAEYGIVGDFGEKNRGINLFSREAVGPYPYLPLVGREQTDVSNMVMASLDFFPMCWPSALKADMVRHEDAGRTVTVLAKTTDLGHRRPEIGSVGTTLDFPMPDASELSALPLVLLVEGPFTSMWKGKPRPLSDEEKREREAEAKEKAEQEAQDAERAGGDPDGDASGDPDGGDPGSPDDDEADPTPADADDADDADADAEDGDDETVAEEEPERRFDEGDTRIVIVGDAELTADYMGPQRTQFGDAPPANGMGGFSLTLGMIDWLRGSEDLISLRGRDTNPRRIEELSASDEQMIKWLNLTAVPFLILCIGLVVFAVRRSQRS